SSFMFIGTATTELYSLSLHDALPIYAVRDRLGLVVGHGRAVLDPTRAGRHARAMQERLDERRLAAPGVPHEGNVADLGRRRRVQDRKSTRLNSSHVKISYAGFCLKKR